MIFSVKSSFLYVYSLSKNESFEKRVETTNCNVINKLKFLSQNQRFQSIVCVLLYKLTLFNELSLISACIHTRFSCNFCHRGNGPSDEVNVRGCVEGSSPTETILEIVLVEFMTLYSSTSPHISHIY